MAIDKAVDSSVLNAGLTSIANAIRTKGGTSAQLAFPAGFVTAIGAIAPAPTLFAYIFVDYPSGSTCTCSDGVTTLTAVGTSGKWMFSVPAAGTWRVTSVDGSLSKYTDVTITYAGQIELIALSYILNLYSQGNEFVSVTGGWMAYTTDQYGPGVLTKNMDEIKFKSDNYDYQRRAGTTNAVNLTDITTLYFIGRNGSTASSVNAIFGVASTQNGAIVKSETIPTGDRTSSQKTLFVGDLTGNYFVFVANKERYTELHLEELRGE